MAIGYLEKRRMRRVLREALARQFRLDLARLFEEQPDLLETGGGRKTITAHALRVRDDFQNCTDAEARTRLETGQDVLREAAELARSRAGTTELRGGTLLVLWNAPLDQKDHPARACSAALSMLACSAERAGVGRSGAGSRSRVTVSAGIATGRAAIGLVQGVGGPVFAAAGAVVELAEELARLAAAYGVASLVSEETIAAARGVILAREIDMVLIDEDTPRVRVFEVLGKAEEFDAFASRFEHYGLGLAAYRGRCWSEARRCFEQAVAACPDDRPARVMLERCRRLEMDEPAPDWTPVTFVRRLS